VSDEYRSQFINRRVEEREQAYIDSLFGSADFRIEPGAAAVAKRLVDRFELGRLSPVQRSLVLARYREGDVTLGELLDHLTHQGANARQAIAGSDTSALQGMLRNVVRTQLLIRAAREREYEPSPERADSLTREARMDLRVAAVTSGLSRSDVAHSDSALVAAVDRALLEALTRQRSPDPMIRVAPLLRERHTVQVYPDRFSLVAKRLAELRSGTSIENGPVSRNDGASSGGSRTPEAEVR
jgi:hypothetical protein